MTQLQETYELAAGRRGHDALFGDPLRAHVVEAHGVLYIEGTGSRLDEPGEWAEDLLVVPGTSGWVLFWRDPAGALEEVWTREWQGGQHHETWDTLVTEAYEL